MKKINNELKITIIIIYYQKKIHKMSNKYKIKKNKQIIFKIMCKKQTF